MCSGIDMINDTRERRRVSLPAGVGVLLSIHSADFVGLQKLLCASQNNGNRGNAFLSRLGIFECDMDYEVVSRDSIGLHRAERRLCIC